MMKTFVLSAVALLAVSSTAYAGGVAAVQVEPVVTVTPAPAFTYDWSGAYVGAMLGTNWSDNSTGDFTTTDDPPVLVPGISFSSHGYSAGVGAGYNFQSNNIVYGVEVDASTASIDGKLDNFLDDGLGTTYSASTNTDWIASARGRLGYASERSLFYITGGFAAAGIETQLTDSYDGGATVFTPSVSDTRSGWVAGAGAEFTLDPQWSMKVEYLHYDFGSETQNFVESAGRTISTDASYTNDQARIGFNYHF
jgi:outer membrane immunogenic protein